MRLTRLRRSASGSGLILGMVSRWQSVGSLTLTGVSVASGYDLTIAGLLRKRAEMAGQAEALRAQLTAKLSALDHLDATIRIFKPDIDLEDLPERPVAPALSGARGDLQRFLIDQLRRSNHPLDTFELAERVMAERGLDAEDRVIVKLIQRRTGYALAKLRNKGRVTSGRVDRSAPLEWSIAERTKHETHNY